MLAPWTNRQWVTFATTPLLSRPITVMVPTLNEDIVNDLSLQNQCMASSLLEEGPAKNQFF